MTPKDLKSAFSMPICDPAYGPPPYHYRAVEDMFIPFEAERSSVEAVLPPGLSLPAGPAKCWAWARWAPFTSFGAYHEAYIMIEAEFDGLRYLYQPCIVVDNEIPLAAGREIWGYPKKLASFTRSWGGLEGGFGEQLLFTVERQRTQLLMRASMVCARKANAEELGDPLPVLSLRLIPSASSAARPSVAELVRLDVKSSLRLAADGSAELYAGAAHLELAGGAADHWRAFSPTKIHDGFFAILDFDLEFGKVVHDYLQDGEIWS